MARTPDRAAEKRPPTHAVATFMFALSGFMVLMAVPMLLTSAWSIALVDLAMGAAMFAYGVLVRRTGSGVRIVNAAYNAALAGRVEEAEELLDQAEMERQPGYIARSINLQRAYNALRRGDLDTAEARAAAALRGPKGFWGLEYARMQVVAAQALRALLFASKGDRAAARAEIEAVRASPDVAPDVLARAEVAEAIVLERSGDRDALAKHLASRRRLLLDWAQPRERAIVRAYRRMLAAPRTGVYRAAASRDAEPELGVTEWIARIAPGAAPFAAAPAPQKPAGAAPSEPRPEAEDPIEPELSELAEKRLAGKGPFARLLTGGKVLLIWVLVIMFFLATWQFLNPPAATVPSPDPEPTGEGGPIWFNDFTPLIVLAVLLVIGALVTMRLLGATRRLVQALTADARGDEDAEEKLQALARSRAGIPSASARLALATRAERACDFDESLAQCDRALAAIARNPNARIVADAILSPGLMAQRAFVLAATDRDGEARAEMRLLAKRFPAYPFLAVAEARVEVVRCVRRGDLEGAARLADARGEDLPLSHRDETLADLARIAARPGSAGAVELARLGEELRVDPELRRWLDVIAPDVVSAFHRATAAEPDEAKEAQEAEEAEREHEALAEEEAAVANG